MILRAAPDPLPTQCRSPASRELLTAHRQFLMGDSPPARAQAAGGWKQLAANAIQVSSGDQPARFLFGQLGAGGWGLIASAWHYEISSVGAAPARAGRPGIWGQMAAIPMAVSSLSLPAALMAGSRAGAWFLRAGRPGSSCQQASAWPSVFILHRILFGQKVSCEMAYATEVSSGAGSWMRGAASWIPLA